MSDTEDTDIYIPPAPRVPTIAGVSRVSWFWLPRPTGVRGLEDWCRWLNFLDGLLTAHALTGGNSIELNLFMRKAWSVSPLVYGTLKFWLFWFGLKVLERSVPSGSHLRESVLRGLFVAFLLVDLWHLFVLSISN